MWVEAVKLPRLPRLVVALDRTAEGSFVEDPQYPVILVRYALVLLLD